MERYKAGQGNLTRLVAWMVLILGVALGCVELYAWIQTPAPPGGEAPWADRPLVPLEWFAKLPVVGVPFSFKVLSCLALFVLLLLLVRWWMRRPTTTDTLIETELEMKKVSWPTKQESLNATWVVVLVTVVLTVTLAAFDFGLHLILKLVF